MRRDYRHAVPLAAAVFMGACFYDAGDTCERDMCINHPPVAAISDLDDDGALRVGGVGEVLVSARDSNDPDGDALTFAWSATEPCAQAVSGATDTEELRLLNLPIGATCEVSLTVSDGRGLSASVTATLIVRNIGGYVSPGQPCAATFDVASEAPQGTASNPFCTVDQALLAADALHLAEVSLGAGNHEFTGVMAIDFPVRLRGGYQRSQAPWTFSLTTVSSIVLNQGSVTDDARIAASDGVTLAIADLAVRRNGACNGNCALVVAEDASLDLHTVTLGDQSPAPDANDAAGHDYVSVLVKTSRGRGDEPQRLVVRAATINGSANANNSTAILVDGNTAVDIDGARIREAALVSAGIRSTNAGTISIKQADIQLQLAGVDARGYGIIDGDREAITLVACPSGVTCNASASLLVEDSTIGVSGGDVVLGICALGTRSFRVTSNVITVAGQKAWGLLSSAVGNARVENQIVTASTRRNRGDIQAYAVGYSDSFETLAAPDGGSDIIEIVGNAFDTRVEDDTITQAAGINLVSSHNVSAARNIIRVSGTGAASSVVENVAGIRMLSVRSVTIDEGSVTIEALKATERSAGIADGQPFDGGALDPQGSRDIVIHNVGIKTAVVTDLNTINACVFVTGAETVRIMRDQPSLALMECAASGSGIVMGIYSAANHDLQIKGLGLAVSATNMITGVFGATHVGIHDGGISPGMLDRASTQLVVSGNVIRMNEAGRTQIGVRIRGHVATGMPIVANNVILGSGSTNNIGVLLHAAEGIVALNSIRLAGCTICASPFGIGVYLMHTDGFSGTFLGNVVSTTSGMDPQYRPAFVRHSTGVVAPVIGTVAYTLYSSETAGSEAPLIAARQDTSAEILPPAGMTPYSEDVVGGTGNAPAPPTYCPDGIHGDPAGGQRAAASGMTETYGLDIDGESRDLTTLDAGADVIGDACP